MSDGRRIQPLAVIYVSAWLFSDVLARDLRSQKSFWTVNVSADEGTQQDHHDLRGPEMMDVHDYADGQGLFPLLHLEETAAHMSLFPKVELYE